MELPSSGTAAKMQPLELTEYQECVWQGSLDRDELQALARRASQSLLRLTERTHTS